MPFSGEYVVGIGYESSTSAHYIFSRDNRDLSSYISTHHKGIFTHRAWTISGFSLNAVCLYENTAYLILKNEMFDSTSAIYYLQAMDLSSYSIKNQSQLTIRNGLIHYHSGKLLLFSGLQL